MTRAARALALVGALLTVALGGCRSSRAPRAADASVALSGLDAPRARGADFRRGASLGLFVSDPDPAVQRRIYATMLDEMAEAGVTDVQLVVRWGQQTIHDVDLRPWPALTPQDTLLAWVIGAARQRNLRVFLMPIVHIEQRAIGVWRGTLAPTDLEAWWARYRDFVLHYARLAERSGGVGLFAVGSELLSLEADAARWRALIADVRAAFRGQLTYSANWDHYAHVPFWDAVDVVGLTAYHELSPAPDPDEAALVAGWASWADALVRWADARDLRFVFTEVGYPSTEHGAARPWDHREGARADLDLQLRCYRALYRVWQAQPRLAGLYVWNWFGFGGAGDRGYSPRGKPAVEVVRHWYRGRAAGGGETP